MKIIILIVFAVILYCLGSAAFYLVKRSDADKLARALTWRIALSIALFLLLILSAFMGWVHPHGITP